MSKDYRRLVNVYVNDENADGPDTAVIHIDEEKNRRIRQLARAVKRLDVAYIEDWDCSAELRCKTDTLDYSDEITDETPLEEVALIVNDENPVKAILAKHRLAGNSVMSEEAVSEIKETLTTEWDHSSDCETLRVSRDDFHFCGSIKHTNATWETEGIPLKDLPQI
jgi:hypothetical protein